jgi:anthranilate synthase component 2
LTHAMRPILFIDNEDSFVYNLVDACESAGHAVEVYRGDWPLDEALRYLERARPRLLVLSPGPCGPRDARLSMQLLAAAPEELPIFGVCLGHQCIVEFFGGRVEPTGEPAHGKAALIRHDGGPLWAGVENPFPAGRYHSLAASRVPDVLQVTATLGDRVMAVLHRTRPVFGVQFHPESVLTPAGHRLLHNVLTRLGNET